MFAALLPKRREAAFLEVGGVQLFSFQDGFLGFPLSSLYIRQLLQQACRAIGTTEAIQVLAFSIFVLHAVFVGKGRGVDYADRAGIGSVRKKGIEGCEEYTVHHGAPRDENILLGSLQARQ
jgi:hypothetical protein